MRQLTSMNEEVKSRIISFERQCELLCQDLYHQYRDCFKNSGELVVDFLRKKKCKIASATEMFDPGYESFIEIGIERDEEFYSYQYITIWKCRNEWCQRIGYSTPFSIEELRQTIVHTIEEMMADEGEEQV
jgi:hypothetical protein